MTRTCCAQRALPARILDSALMSISLLAIAIGCRTAEPSVTPAVMLHLPGNNIVALPGTILGTAIYGGRRSTLFQLDEASCRLRGIAGYFEGMDGSPVLHRDGSLFGVVEGGVSAHLPCVLAVQTSDQLLLRGSLLDADRTAESRRPQATRSEIQIGQSIALTRWSGDSPDSPIHCVVYCVSDTAIMARPCGSDTRLKESATYAVHEFLPVAIVNNGDALQRVGRIGSQIGHADVSRGSDIRLSPSRVVPRVEIRLRDHSRAEAITEVKSLVVADPEWWREWARGSIQSMLVSLDYRRSGYAEIEVAVDGVNAERRELSTARGTFLSREIAIAAMSDVIQSEPPGRIDITILR